MIQKAMERPKKRIKTKRTRSSNEYRLASKKILKEKKRQRKMDW